MKKNKYSIDEKSVGAMHAGSKARDDVSEILKKEGYTLIELECDYLSGFISSIKSAVKETITIIKTLNSIEEESVVFFQHPYGCYSNYLGYKIHKICNKRNIKTIILIHDIDKIRYESFYGKKKGFVYTKFFRDDISYLNNFDYIICHNESMKKYLIKVGLKENKLIALGIFDYLINQYNNSSVSIDNYKKVIVAGNLDEKKATYVYKLKNLENSSYNFELYGVNYTGKNSNFVHYNGAFKPDDLPKYINYGFGLIWDGESTSTCVGPIGNYLRYNNPHKLSSYITCNIPVIVWKEAAVAKFVEEHKIGLTISNLNELQTLMDNLTLEEYNELKLNVTNIKTKLITGTFLKNALNKIEKLEA